MVKKMRVYAIADPKQTGTTIEWSTDELSGDHTVKVKWDNVLFGESWMATSMVAPLEDNPLPEKRDDA